MDFFAPGGTGEQSWSSELHHRAANWSYLLEELNPKPGKPWVEKVEGGPEKTVFSFFTLELAGGRQEQLSQGCCTEMLLVEKSAQCYPNKMLVVCESYN